MAANKAKKERDEEQRESILFDIILFEQLNAHTSEPCNLKIAAIRSGHKQTFNLKLPNDDSVIKHPFVILFCD